MTVMMLLPHWHHQIDSYLITTHRTQVYSDTDSGRRGVVRVSWQDAR